MGLGFLLRFFNYTLHEPNCQEVCWFTTHLAYCYPDVVVFCGEPQFEDNVFDTLLNPILVVEVLSPSTEVYDSGEKFRHYQELASLQEYILVSQDRVRVEQYRLAKTQWVQNFFAHWRARVNFTGKIWFWFSGCGFWHFS